MGVSGLLPILKPVIEDAHVRDFAGKKLAIDAFAWLHKAAFTCAYELAMGMPTDKYVHYIMQRVEMMRSLDVTPLLVFDGMSMPAKKVTNDQRSQMRASSLLVAAIRHFSAAGMPVLGGPTPSWARSRGHRRSQKMPALNCRSPRLS